MRNTISILILIGCTVILSTPDAQQTPAPRQVHPDAAALRAIVKLAADAKLQAGKFDAATQKQLQAMTAALTQATVRRDTEELLTLIEQAANQHARDRVLLVEIKRLGGKTTSEVVAPAWLRKVLDDPELALFSRLVLIELNERTDGHKDPTPKKPSDRVTDEWLKHLAGQDQLRPAPNFPAPRSPAPG